MESDMIQRVALAIWQQRELTFPRFTQRMKPDDIDYASGAWLAVVLEAQAAIAAMREPTEVMIGAGFRPAYVRSVEAPPVVYRAMIDAALAPSPTPQG